MILLAWMGCMSEGVGVAAEYRFPLAEPARFEVRASSSLDAKAASRVELAVYVEREDDVLLEQPPRVVLDEVPLRHEEGWFPTDVDLFPCDGTCAEDVVFVIEPTWEGSSEVYVSFELLAYGTSRNFPAWEHLDLGVGAPQVAQ